jgi:hypothetical protein
VRAGRFVQQLGNVLGLHGGSLGKGPELTIASGVPKVCA